MQLPHLSCPNLVAIILQNFLHFEIMLSATHSSLLPVHLWCRNQPLKDLVHCFGSPASKNDIRVVHKTHNRSELHGSIDHGNVFPS